MLQTRATLVSPSFSGHEEDIADPDFRARLLDSTSDRYKINDKLKPAHIPHKASFRKLNID